MTDQCLSIFTDTDLANGDAVLLELLGEDGVEEGVAARV